MNLCERARLLRDKGNRLVAKAQELENQIFTTSTKMTRDRAAVLTIARHREVVKDLYKKAKDSYREASATWDQGRCGAGVGGSKRRKGAKARPGSKSRRNYKPATRRARKKR